jgi:hypothetical protein
MEMPATTEAGSERVGLALEGVAATTLKVA